MESMYQYIEAIDLLYNISFIKQKRISMHSTQQNKYGFEENFNGSSVSVSEESQDIIIVEPLDEQKQAINKANALYLTGQNHSIPNSSYGNKPVINSTISSKIYSQTNQSNQPEHQPYFQQSQRPKYDPNASVPRKYDPNLLQRTQQQQQQLQSNANPQLISIMEPQPRITQSIIYFINFIEITSQQIQYKTN